MARLGVILAGGQSKRFGSDKASFAIDGLPLLDHIRLALAQHVDAVAVVGRFWPGLATIDDYPEPGLGPLGGLCGALIHARQAGYAGVVTAPCDTLPIPVADLVAGGEATVIASQPLIGWWPVAWAEPLADWLATRSNRAVFGWLDAAQVRRIEPAEPLFNLNTADDLRRWQEKSAVMGDRGHDIAQRRPA